MEFPYPDRYFSGIGSRKTPQVILKHMTYICQQLYPTHTCRSGGAVGADSACEAGAGDHKQIFLPYDGFNGRHIDDVYFLNLTGEIEKQARKMAEYYHPAWSRCSFDAKRFHTRNVAQVLGPDLKTPVEFVLCYTERGLLKGGTATALRIAKDHDIPIFNLGKYSASDVLYQLQGYMK